MNYQKPTTEGYYWYRDVDEFNGRGTPIAFSEWDIVKVQLYGKGHYKNNPLRSKKPILMLHCFLYAGIVEVRKSKGIWGAKVSKLKGSTNKT